MGTPTPAPDERKRHRHHHHHDHDRDHDRRHEESRDEALAADRAGETRRGGPSRTLVAITSYGNHRTDWLHHLIDTYRSMSNGIDVVVFADTPRPLPRGVGQIVGMPDENPYSLAFAHKSLFASERENYDLFLYTEDDILITEENLDAFHEATAYLGEREVAGFLRYELDPAGDRRFVDVHPPFDWVDRTTRRSGPYVFTTFSNDHSGCYLLTRAQLRRAIASGHYLVPPHQSYYDFRESAATDPYTLCGLTKRVCLSHLDRFLVRHLVPNTEGILGLDELSFRRQVGWLLADAG